ncbi:hypothetical protein [Amphibacillus jilinensis]|uniref:hypothetical protein n=1 Tax=Amphibacillus jilinensis TaxID=1216008 RepID=UPI00030F6D1E|nr:hypothetical protein [Amphibacillus jilinensis]
MRSYLLLVLFIMSVLLLACSDNPPVIVQEEIDSSPNEGVAFVEEEQGKDPEDPDSERQQFIEFTLTDRQISLHIDQIPILSNYLAQHTNRNQAIENMQLTQIDEDEFDSLFLLSFACENNSCSYLLLDTETEQSKLLADQAEITRIDPSADHSKLLIKFERQATEQAWNSNKVMLFDLDNWNEYTFDVDDSEAFIFNAFRSPILTVEWVDDSAFKVQIPDVSEPTIEQLTNWFNANEKTTRDVIISLED